MARALGDRLRHIHMTDGTGSAKDEHLVPGRGNQPVAELLEHLASVEFRGHIVVEINTRRSGTREVRELDLMESLAFVRLNFATPELGVLYGRDLPQAKEGEGIVGAEGVGAAEVLEPARADPAEPYRLPDDMSDAPTLPDDLPILHFTTPAAFEEWLAAAESGRGEARRERGPPAPGSGGFGPCSWPADPRLPS